MIERSIPTPAGKTNWQSTTVRSILTNEKYKGDAILQKTFCTDFLTKKMKINEGEVPQYYVENSHPAIIPPETFDLVQHELKQRKARRGYKASASPFSGRVFCGECRSVYGSKVWHSNTKYRSLIWRCNHKYNGKKCSTPHIRDTALQTAFVDAANQIIGNKGALLRELESALHTIVDTSPLEKKRTELQEECDVVMKLMRKCVEENAHTSLAQDEYHKRYNALLERHETTKSGLEAIDAKASALMIKREKATAFFETLKMQEDLLDTFDEKLWIAIGESMTVHSEGSVEVVFKGGASVMVETK